MNRVDLDQELVRTLTIPPRPEIVTVLMEEMSRDAPNLDRISGKIAADVGLAGAMLKVVNSPAFRRPQPARSVSQAVSLLGLRNVSSIATGLVIRHTLGGGPQQGFERFWDTAEKVGLICSFLARALRGMAPDEAFTVGLFHDCGIPLLMRRFPVYRDVLAQANQSAERGFFEVEEEAIGTHHGAVGYFLARSWLLPDDLCKAVLWHHDAEVFVDPAVDDSVRNYVGIIHIAQHIQHLQMRSTTDVEWIRFSDAVLTHFALTEEDFINLVDEAQEMLAENRSALC